MGKCGLITTGILALISGAYSVVIGGLVLVEGASGLCTQAESTAVQQGVEINVNNFTNNCNFGVNTYAGLAIGGGSLWILIALFVFVFACGSRYDAFLAERDQADKDVVIMVQQNQATMSPEQPRVVNGTVTGDNV